MIATGSPHARIDEYLSRLRDGLRTLPADQVTDIVEEIRSHILDAAGPRETMTDSGLQETLSRLGPAAALASTYVTQSLLVEAARSRSPWLLLKSSFHWAALSVQGLFVFMGAVIGYSLAAIFSFCALAKPINPRNVGLWAVGDNEYSLHLGLSGTPAPGHELLGWSIIPIGLVISMGLVLFTTEIGLRTIRRFQRERPLRLRV
jgi:hypothetical protein